RRRSSSVGVLDARARGRLSNQTAADGTVSPPAWRPRRAAPGDPGAFTRSAGRWIGAIVSTLTLVVCLSIAGTSIARLTQADQDATAAITAIFVAAGIGTV